MLLTQRAASHIEVNHYCYSSWDVCVKVTGARGQSGVFTFSSRALDMFGRQTALECHRELSLDFCAGLIIWCLLALIWLLYCSSYSTMVILF